MSKLSDYAAVVGAEEAAAGAAGAAAAALSAAAGALVFDVPDFAISSFGTAGTC